MAKRRRVVRRATTALVPPHTGGPDTQSTYALIEQAVSDADRWWAGQGSAPQQAQIEYVNQLPTQNEPGASAYAYYGSGRMQFSNDYVNRLSRMMASPSLKARRAALQQLWGLAAHERGHNLSYQDATDQGIMNPNLPAIPGRAYEWAAQLQPKRRVLRRGGRGV